jgi:urease accessory protein
MLIKQKIGNLQSFDVANRSIDLLPLEWYETNKRILHKRTQSGREVIMKFMNEAQSLTDEDVLWSDETTLIVVSLQPCEAIIVTPASMFQMASVCYEIGNKHLPLFYDNDELLVPYDAPLFKLLTAAGYAPKKETRKLLNQLKTTVTPHSSGDNKQTLFSKILKLTTSSAGE